MTMSADAQPIERDEAQAPHETGVVVPMRPAEPPSRRAALEADVEAACATVAPLFPLRGFVAVNAFLGFADQPFESAVGEIERLLHARPLMPEAYYRDRLAEGRIDAADVRQALGPLAAERGQDDVPSLAPIRRVETLAEAVDRAEGTEWHRTIVSEISRFLAARFDDGQGTWQQPFRGESLWRAWRAMASADLNPELLGLRGFRAYVAGLPESPWDAIEAVLDQLGVAPDGQRDRLTRTLASIGGWAAHVQAKLRHGAAGRVEPETLVHLLAIRLAYDGALDQALEHSDGGRREDRDAPTDADRAGQRAGLDRRLALQTAFERSYQRALIGALASEPQEGPGSAPAKRPALQAVFCIDVRSEPLRRHLETASSEVETIGFAGFFGFALEYVRSGASRGDARCPVLLEPSVRIAEVEAPGSGAGQRAARGRRRHLDFAALRKLAVGAYPLVETAGHFFGLRLLTDSLGWTRVYEGGALSPRPGDDALRPGPSPDARAEAGFGLTISQQIDLAESALRNMGLVRRFAEVVLLCGHGSDSTNNPYASGLDCGACGGHPGDVNARVAAAVLDAPDVRRGLAARGIEIPDDTVFVAAMHDTTKDEVRVFDDAGRLSPDRRARISAWLDAACAATRAERAGRLGERVDAGLARRLRRRAGDWSEVRPEWGLAGNAAFVAAPRARTRGLDLGGRVFLHDYDDALDGEGRVLELILTAPLVVASWINLQYFASTVDNEKLGSGNKVLHNVTGRHGVQLGNRSDLQTGLPWQSVHDGERFVHEPLRLTAIVATPGSRIDAVLDAHDDVRQLVENGWIHLIAWDIAAGTFHRRTRSGWEPVDAPQGLPAHAPDAGAARGRADAHDGPTA